MLICNHPDFDYKKACFDAYNRWLQTYCSHAPDRLVGLGQTAMRTVKEGIADLERIKAMGFKGVMMPGNPGEIDYDDPAYDPFWEAAVALELPLSCHILTSSGDNSLAKPRGPKINGFLVDHPRLPGHHGHAGLLRRVRAPPRAARRLRRGRRRLGAAFHVPHGPRLQAPPLLDEGQGTRSACRRSISARTSRSPSRTTGRRSSSPTSMHPQQLMWANDFPHSDSTWPWSQDVLKEQTGHLTPELRKRILHDNVAELYKLAA